ncbi:Acyl transferase/acyl hydrolase/lysophospholipase [Cordyceps fumosorosea ARSEF 2679]|uniref:Patatin-like phospholipase domain-containing protein n=1 Tax=Cordyceps fumosorosea (strain ARSEF 2679) TaxID=1081104 RepID=A0A167PAV6_CORFA|nr:Acyl transferase/acyl hydrolase/lysophospholipase [Cordyceps fumosorosea ARSEF 2679]OAA56472.1 Acyl transferase/acyl hydrolase/lysophospholipase [Cordyceps fumosorosea ARSEF 2679]
MLGKEREKGAAPSKTTSKTPSFPSLAPNYGFPPEAFDVARLPDSSHEFISPADIAAFEAALQAPDQNAAPAQNLAQQQKNGSFDALRSPKSPGSFSITRRDSHSLGAGLDDDADNSSALATAAAAAAANGDFNTNEDVALGGLESSPAPGGHGTFVTAQNDWAPISSRFYRTSRRKPAAVPKKKRRRAKQAVEGLLGTRSKDETRDGYLYMLAKWPLLLFVVGWLLVLSVLYLLTRFYIVVYEQLFTWRGRREGLRRELRGATTYEDWVRAARALDGFLGRKSWREENDFAYYDSKTVKRVWDQMKKTRAKAEREENDYLATKSGNGSGGGGSEGIRAVEELKALTEACVKNNFVGIDNPKLYSQTYYGTKNLVQNFVDEVERTLKFLLKTKQLTLEEKRVLFKHVQANFGRTALCLSGGASFAYYHFGLVRALLDADLLPDVITGTSGGALIAGLVATRTNEELKKLLVPALASQINACSEGFTTWFPRWWKTGARFDSVSWAAQCSWWTRGSMTFREAYERTGRILNVSCVPADPHSPTILCNYLTSPDCVIWSAVLASAAVPGILNPVVLMMKKRDGTLAPYSFGHKWKDGSLRTDIPIKALNTHFNVNFTIVSQVNPHVNLFFFSSRGRVGNPVTHRKGRGWRGGFLMSATEHYLKLDMHKWLRFVRHAELLPRPLGQDWSQLWLQEFSGTVTLWPAAVASDFWRILSDPDAGRLARMLHEGRQGAFPALQFVGNRLKVERMVDRGRTESRPWVRRGSLERILSEDDLRSILVGEMVGGGGGTTEEEMTTDLDEEVVIEDDKGDAAEGGGGLFIRKR